ncbi:MAG: hypothetical protein K0B16_18845 [Burkholderiaceae bacterium]|nr:hypothetical protein [Burkholderiaceae bacterium]
MWRLTPSWCLATHLGLGALQRGGRTGMRMTTSARSQTKIEHALVKPLTGAFRWKRKQESRHFASIAELAEREGVAQS